MKDKVSWTIDSGVLERLQKFRREKYPGLSTSAVAEILIRDSLPRADVSVVEV